MIKNYTYSGKCEETVLSHGQYIIEAWGAQGGNFTSSGCKGGYSRGLLEVKKPTSIIICVGGKGTEASPLNNVSPFNGGGKSSFVNEYSPSMFKCGTGGGMTSFQLSNNLQYMLVAGAGGGGTQYLWEGEQMDVFEGGYGGGIAGGTDNDSFSYAGKGGNQSSGGDGGFYSSDSTYAPVNGEAGSYGQGGNGATSALACPGGGGGGFYGGGGGADYGPGGGGSGYIAPYLKQGVLISGNDTFNDPNSNPELGHSGDGYARITYISCTIPPANLNARLIVFHCYLIF